MKVSFVVALAILSVVTGLASSVCADVVTITPSNPGDWSWTYNAPGSSKQHAYFTKGGPALAEGNPIPTGNGAFYAWLGWGGGDYASTPYSAWIGLDKFHGVNLSGIKLSQIKKLEYTVYNAGQWNQDQGGMNPRRFPGQPFMVSLNIVDPNTNPRCLWFRPWGHRPLGWQHWNNRRAWLTLDAINMTSTPDFGRAESSDQWPALWYNWWFDNATPHPKPNSVYTSFAQMCAATSSGSALFGDSTLAPTSTTYDPANGQWKSAGWDDTTVPVGDPRRSTGTGKPLNLWIGARKAVVGELGAWCTESMNFSGYVDTVTLGIDLDNDGVLQDSEVTTFDFASDEPEPTQVCVCDVGKSLWSLNPPITFPYASYTPAMNNHWYRGQMNQHQFLYRFQGQVLDKISSGGGPQKDPDTHEFYFTIWDGTYAKSGETGTVQDVKATIMVRLPYQDCHGIDNNDWGASWPVHIGDWVSVEGFLYDRFFRAGDAAPPPAEITAKSVSIHLLNWPPQ